MNVMTEEEAKGKWCPFARVSEVGEAGGAYTHSPNRNLSPDLSGAAVCITSQCMSWRWWDGLSDDGTAHDRKPTSHAARVPEPPEGRPLAQRRGFCGLAGRPTP